MEGMPPELAVTYSATAKLREQKMQFKAEGCPPEEVLVNTDCRSIDDPRFIAHRRRVPVSDLLSLGYPKKKVEALPDDTELEADRERHGRHDQDGTWFRSDDGDKSQRMVTLTEAYIKVDQDGDGVAEFRRVVVAGDTVFENEVTDDHPFALFSPVLMPYKVIGLSMYDLVEDLQRIKTALTRQVLDNVYLSNMQRTEVVEGQVNMDDLLSPQPGGMVRVKAPGMTRDITVPFIAEAGMALITQIDGVRDTRTGVTEMNSALNSESLAKSNIGSEGVAAMQQAGAQRIELIARVLAETGIKRLWLLMLKNVSQYQDRTQQIRLNGKWLEIDPREWKNKYDMTVSVGIGTAGKQQQVQNLMMLGTAQREAFEIGLATPQNIYHTLTKLTEAMGYKDSDQFFTMPDGQPKPEAPDPAIVIEQMKQQGAMQLAQMKGQVDIQVEQMKQESQAQQAQQETQLEAERNQLEMRNTMMLEQFKVEQQKELELAKARIAQQTAIQTARISALGNEASGGEEGEDGEPVPVRSALDRVGDLIERMATTPPPSRAKRGRIRRDAAGRAEGIDLEYDD